MKEFKIDITIARNHYPELKNRIIDLYNEEAKTCNKELYGYKKRSCPFIITYNLSTKGIRGKGRRCGKKIGDIKFYGLQSKIFINVKYDESQESQFFSSYMFINLIKITQDQKYKYIAEFKIN